MPEFQTLLLPKDRTLAAPDGSDVRVLLGLKSGGMEQFHLDPGHVSKAVTHRTVEEIWYVVTGEGQMWRKEGQHEEVTELVPGLCLTIPLGTHFQFRANPNSGLSVVAVTIPPWPGDGEAVEVAGHW